MLMFYFVKRRKSEILHRRALNVLNSETRKRREPVYVFLFRLSVHTQFCIKIEYKITAFLRTLVTSVRKSSDI